MASNSSCDSSRVLLASSCLNLRFINAHAYSIELNSQVYGVINYSTNKCPVCLRSDSINSVISLALWTVWLSRMIIVRGWISICAGSIAALSFFRNSTKSAWFVDLQKWYTGFLIWFEIAPIRVVLCGRLLYMRNTMGYSLNCQHLKGSVDTLKEVSST